MPAGSRAAAGPRPPGPERSPPTPTLEDVHFSAPLHARPLAPSGVGSASVNSRESVTGWGGGRLAPVSVVRPEGIDALQEAIANAGSTGHDRYAPVGGGFTAGRYGAIARGLGRSYGDAAQLTHGLVVQLAHLREFTLDHERGVVTAQAGVSIRELLAELVPAGWVVPVVPGTQHVTVGGAIASDIHGKNHGSVGTFGSHVRALGLLTSDGQLRELAPEAPDGLFEATLGGMGLTGVIVWAEVQLRALGSAALSVDTDRVDDLDGALAALRAPGGPHRVAWLDLLGSRPVRGVVTRAAELDAGQVLDSENRANRHVRHAQATVPARMTVPRRWPAGLLRKSAVRAFNELRFRQAPRRRRGEVESFGAHMFPLDALDRWPRLYGPGGFVQYQLVIAPGKERVIELVIGALRAHEVPCYLAVLKDFGLANSAPLSFPIEGWTLALDLPRAAPALESCLRDCDRLVAEAGGRVYLSKDARLSPDCVAAMYPRLDEWRTARDRADPVRLWRSDLALRTGLVG